MGRFHTVAWVPVLLPAGATRPLLISAEGDLLLEPWEFLAQLQFHRKSSAWFEKAAKHLGSLYDFFRARDQGLGGSELTPDLLSEFAVAMASGTIQPDGTDPLSLYWDSVSEDQYVVMLRIVRAFAAYCSDTYTDGRPGHRMLAWAMQQAQARELRRSSSDYYRGVHSKEDAGGASRGVGEGPRVRSVHVFPRKVLPELLFNGTRRLRLTDDFDHEVANEYNVTLILALLLVAGTGIRKSELFHIFIDDVRPGEVRLYHPTRGLAVWQRDGRPKQGSRQAYLAENYGLRPRSLLPKHDSQFAGWKSMLLDYGDPQNYSVVQWISDSFRRTFEYFHGIYIKHVRPRATNHPYYFVSLSHTEYGHPWTVDAFTLAFNAALERIGLSPNASRGLNLHGLRHLYGRTLVQLGLKPTEIQEAMHHQSLLSQLPYTKPSPEEVNNTLRLAACKLEGGAAPCAAPSSFGAEYEWQSDLRRVVGTWRGWGGAR